ncbi:penicillin-insensitive murein endopeptidase [Hyphomicrobium sp.]|uniref:penicillin-insensitive murein endopeptidase n=1 Tax=Hyphomicrobium sp. TaxID=82 RepID=UPI003F716D98
MSLIRHVAPWLLPLLVLASSARAEDAAVTDDGGRSWHGPARLAAEAAEAQIAEAQNQTPADAFNKSLDNDAVVPPAPKPAERPAATKVAPKDKAATPKKADPAPAAKAAEPAAKPAGAAPAAKKELAKQDTAQPGADKNDAGKTDAKAAKKEAKKPVPSAKQLFGTVKTAAPLKARAVGWYAKGCLSGGKALAVDGPGWQVMRLARNRNWGHPDLVALLERLAKESTAAKEWSGLLVGDMSQPRGGPMTSGHASHQVGLDADIWLTPMPDRTLTRREREDMSAVSMLANAGAVDPKVWGDGQVKLIKRAASYTSVERILVHPALKKALCEAAGKDRHWLNKVRPYFGHFYHFHVRIGCPSGSTNCQAQPPVPDGDGCGAELTDWLKRVAPKKKPPIAQKPPEKPSKPAAPKPEMTLADLPADCTTVLMAGGNKPPTEPAEVVDLSKNAGPENDVTAVTAAPEPPKPPSKPPDATPTKTN